LTYFSCISEEQFFKQPPSSVGGLLAGT